MAQFPRDVVERAHRAHLGLAEALERMRAIPAPSLVQIELRQAGDWIERP